MASRAALCGLCLLALLAAVANGDGCSCDEECEAALSRFDARLDVINKRFEARQDEIANLTASFEVLLENAGELFGSHTKPEAGPLIECRMIVLILLLWLFLLYGLFAFWSRDPRPRDHHSQESRPKTD
jgi:hypothetical protein